MVRLAVCMGGKAFTYVFLGALAGFAGDQVVQSAVLADGQRLLAWSSGLAMVLFGLAMLGVRMPGLAGRLAPDAGPVAGLYRHFFTSPTVGSSGILGILIGFLPCPATLAMLAVATGSHSLVGGMAVMLGFGAGTAPALTALGLGGASVFSRFRRVGLRLAAVLVIALGALTVVRGSSLLEQVCPSCRAAATCPHCEAAKAEADGVAEVHGQ